MRQTAWVAVGSWLAASDHVPVFLYAGSSHDEGVVIGYDEGALFTGRIDDGDYASIGGTPSFEFIDDAWWRIR